MRHPGSQLSGKAMAPYGAIWRHMAPGRHGQAKVITIHKPRVTIQQGHYSIKLPWHPVILLKNEKQNTSKNYYDDC